ncbi:MULTISPECIES: GIY-YIG nuclease family protein [Aerococcus]|uniref:GIY-YIG nuclease family protein n=2 Tax=Aerococcus TaxID=1375 RepID=A0A329NNT9_9LACT|nr:MULTISPECIES: GIY-YIG nuclease family protein [Aerococcus]KAA9219534.1 GIY-YIG nuclease family protein [Aerococcus loyolae]KAA9266553.1 GIY-YIG nuclease family protein [Aerococcus loyolae]MCY3025939.1 GIY-YIG nuclease family protein [Aerococcus loyolae]MCY3027477.1 GIY-YIG nuclease family protein [Aerococcus loyolae]MCY3029046.1 GIY-YIG nuclease family protein [Aerococcus loyolae]
MYVLLCHDDSLYTGYTTDVDRRQEEHNSGKGAKYTRPASRRPCAMVFAKAFSSRQAATQAEYRFKQFPRAEKIKRLKAYGVSDFHYRPGISCQRVGLDDDYNRERR